MFDTAAISNGLFNQLVDVRCITHLHVICFTVNGGNRGENKIIFRAQNNINSPHLHMLRLRVFNFQKHVCNSYKRLDICSRLIFELYKS
jgi:hypothetical protein